ncbi:hypothetical protein [Nonomuraea sp. NPDC049758]|uniref:hypothetical protein n=1 Tax=Nonomuraea sp. NPDC049758 TaxID=3154360 RepID=UPI0034412966
MMRIGSASSELVAMFEWARAKALRLRHEGGSWGPVDVDEHRPAGAGQSRYLPSYWAGYAHRSGFYARDFAHQIVGAHLLGMAEANLTMLRCFAASATPEHGFHPVWAFNFDGSYLSIDYRGPDSFVRELPAVYELVEKAGTAYRWTWDRAYVEDPVLWSYYRNALTEIVPRATGRGIFQGVASYNELAGEHLAEAGDSVGSRYQAYLAMSALSRARGLDGEDFACRAAELRRHFNEVWSVGENPADLVRGYTVDGAPVTGWGRENSWFMPLKDLIEPGPRNEAYLDFIDGQAAGPERPRNIEAYTYLPDTFFRHDRNAAAWRWMRHVFDRRAEPHVAGGLNGDYPEVSFTLVSQVVEGLLGVTPEVNAVTTLSHLPDDIAWAEVSGIPLGDGTITVRHDGRTATTLTNTSSDTTYRWEARFPDAPAVVTRVAPGQSALVTAPGRPG